MIKGKNVTITDQHRIENLSESYIDFIFLVNKLEIELVEGAKTEIKYINSYPLKNYGLLLNSEFENAISQIEHHIDILQSKDHKIIELRNYTTDFGLLFPFINEESDLLFHKNVSFKNMKLVYNWSNAYPESKDNQTKLNDKYMTLVIESTGGKGPILESENKIMRKIAKEIIIDKSVN